VTLKTRKPTGVVPWPLLLIEGEEKAGKTWACAEFTASPKVGRCFWIDLGEGAADEYGAIPGASYEVVEHDGSFAGLYANVAEIHKLAAQALAKNEKPVVLVIDTMTSEWDLLKDWAADRAKSTRSNRQRLERDPNAEVVITGNLWNDANARHRRLMNLLKTFPGIVLMTAHGKQVAVIGPDGQPVEGKKTHKVEAQKTLGADASCWLRLYREAPGVIVGGRSVHLQFRPGDDPKPLAADWTLEGVIFGVLKCDTSTAHVRDLVAPKADAVTPEQIRDEALRPATVVERVRELYTEARRLGYDDVTVVNGEGDDEALLAMLTRIGNERAGAASQRPAPAVPPGSAADAFENAAPAQANGNGRPSGQVSRPAQPAARPFPQADETVIQEWAARIGQMSGADDVDAGLGELRTLQQGRQVNPATANAIRKALQAKRELLAQRAGEMAAAS
jgi:AAA domain